MLSKSNLLRFAVCAEPTAPNPIAPSTALVGTDSTALSTSEKALQAALSLVRTAMRHIDASQSKARSDARPLLERSTKRPSLGPRPAAKRFVSRPPPLGLPAPTQSKPEDPETAERVRQQLRDSFAALDQTISSQAPYGSVAAMTNRHLQTQSSDATDDGRDDDPPDALLEASRFSLRSSGTGEFVDADDAPASAVHVAATVHSSGAAPPPSRYVSPLFALRAFRLSRHFAAAGADVTSSTWSHRIDPMRTICPYEQSGGCNDPTCKYQHLKDYAPQTDEQMRPQTDGAHSLASSTARRPASTAPSQIQRPSAGESKPKKVVSCFTPGIRKVRTIGVESSAAAERGVSHPLDEPGYIPLDLSTPDRATELTEYRDDVRYYSDTPTGPVNVFSPMANFPTTVVDFEQALSTPDAQANVLLWVDYARLVAGSDVSLPQLRKSGREHVDSVLEIFSRALEAERSSPLLWYCYLTVFPLRAETPAEIDQFCKYALEYTNRENCVLLASCAKLSRQPTDAQELLLSALRSSLQLNPLLPSVVLSRLWDLLELLSDDGRLGASADSAFSLVFAALGPLATAHSRLRAVCFLLKAFVQAEGRIPSQDSIFPLLVEDFISSRPLAWTASTTPLEFDSAIPVIEEALPLVGLETDFLCFAAVDLVLLRYDASRARDYCNHLGRQTSRVGPLLLLQRLRLCDNSEDSLALLLDSEYHSDTRLWFEVVQRFVASAPNQAPHVLQLFRHVVARFDSQLSPTPSVSNLRALFGRVLGMSPSIFLPAHPRALEGASASNDPWMWLIFASFESVLGVPKIVDEIFQAALSSFRTRGAPLQISLLWVQFCRYKKIVASVPELISLASNFLSDWHPNEESWNSAVAALLTWPHVLHLPDARKLTQFLGIAEFENFATLEVILGLIEPSLPQHLLLDFLARILKMFPRNIEAAIRHSKAAFRFGDGDLARRTLQTALKHQPRSVRLWIALIGLESQHERGSSLADTRSLIEEALTYVPQSERIRRWSALLPSNG